MKEDFNATEIEMFGKQNLSISFIVFSSMIDLFMT